ncbi:hypothetical protein FHP25_32530 [Vineibacter terrae]|uniref:Uncharacterized protein n=1 Tax=Vineibacter terrae TaxID=2586908 RepID=A0A5C8PBA9_9HYPH|nr:hypothetical protein [Vineibacter terrae]TXL70849.1 hypothetical protein FHP25_32530 [Vineibacter terrae]
MIQADSVAGVTLCVVGLAGASGAVEFAAKDRDLRDGLWRAPVGDLEVFGGDAADELMARCTQAKALWLGVTESSATQRR